MTHFRRKFTTAMLILGVCYALFGLNMFLNRQKHSTTNTPFGGRIVEGLIPGKGKHTDNTEGGPIVIVSYMRSGSTLTGNILQRNPETFYLFEPLHHLMASYQTKLQKAFPEFPFKSVRHSMELKEEVQSIFRAWFTCDFDFILEEKYRYFSKFFKYGLKTNELMECLNKTATYGIKQSGSCTKSLKLKCLKSKYKVLKTIRTPIHWLYELMHEFPTMKIIHLVRDPRAMVASLKRFGECSYAHGDVIGCSRLLCSNMEDDLTTFEMFSKIFPGRVLRLKFENLATDPLSTSQSLYEYLNFEFTETVQSYVKNVTMSGNSPVHILDSIRPDSRAVVDAWKTAFKDSDLGVVQHMCAYVMKELSYYHFIKPPRDTGGKT